ncbi:hypothetical protein BU23DRAFT_629080 [Bimuria novae-zelandiae CBS 107.79]|uniref:Uncharacterized protein n=1 Tax=Bimuria novae-zelandiae CBS 107.79 TaxID=1447943 RepID=A0A6A5UMH4_9PLEO|nr:hypothetical protein BU23DRAFT_629080 [Bimuria novae-zelandiae CBS 107.79]
MAGAGRQLPEAIATYSPPAYPKESDALNPHNEKRTKIASHSVTSLNKSSGSSGVSKQSKSAEWLPYTLRLSLVWIPTVLSLILGLVVALLYWRSHNNHGLCAESAAVTGWRFAPTLVAVVWAQLITILFNDIQRTEPFARLARSSENVPPASRTLLERPRQVLTAFAHAFNKKHNGGKRSWIILWASVVLVLSSIVISLSSALLASEETQIQRPFAMTRLMPQKGSTLQPLVERDTFFRTTGAILKNVTTSPWISDQYTVLPFWPSESAVSPWDAQYPSTSQTWEAETMVFRNDMQCSPLELVATDIWSYNNTQMSEMEYRMSIRLENTAGCTYNLTFNASDASDFNSWEVGSWSELDAYVVGMDYALSSANYYYNGHRIKPTYSEKFLPNLTVSSYLCKTNHTMAELPVRVSTSTNDFNVDFDVEAFQKAQQTVPPSILNTSGFVKYYTDPEWYTMIPMLGMNSGKPFSGAMALVATQYEFDYYKMMNDTKLPETAARLQRRHFGELLRTSLDVRGASQTEAISGSLVVSERRIIVRMEAAATLVALFAFCFFTMLGIIWLSSVRRRPLHLTHEPATVLGAVSLVSSNPSVLSCLRELDQASTGELRAALKSRYFSASHGHLKEVAGNGELEVAEPTPRIPTLAEKESPVWVKIRVLLLLLFYIAVLIIAITVVHKFASDSDLKKGFFIYRLNVDTLGRLGSFTPFSIIPTALAVLLGLWWNSLDVTFRVLQPYVSMSQAPREISRGAYVSYQSSYWLWATGKATKNRHWLLALVTFGTLLAQAFTIATSALFEQTTGVINDSVQLNKSLELRQTPHIWMMNESYPPTFTGAKGAYGYQYVGNTLIEVFSNLTNNWLYSAVIEATLNGSEPSWSADGWSFVPVNLSELNGHKTFSDANAPGASGSLINITLTSPAIRGRVECYQPEEVRNGGTTWNTNTTSVDPNTNKTVNINYPNYSMFGASLAPDAKSLSCCTNNTNPSRKLAEMAPLAIGFWTQDLGNSTQSVTGSNNNLTVKWIYGDGSNLGGFEQSQIYFRKIPKIQAVKCMPIFETSEAEIVVNKQTGRVLSHRILNDPRTDDSAWSDSFVFHEPTDPNDPGFKKEVEESHKHYGNMFISSLLRASRLGALDPSDISHGSRAYENLDDNVFNIRNNVTGLSLDFMSYAAYVQAGRNPEALLEEKTMLESTQKIFTKFFQHYVSSTVSLTTGGWVYQPIGASLNELGAVVNGTFPQFNPDGTPAKKVSELPAQNTQRTANATMSTRVEVLHMNPSAVWFCVALLGWLAITTIIVTAMQRWYFGELRRNVESIADVLVLVAGSERLLAAVEKYGVEGLVNSDVKTRLGWFRTDDGRMRWGIEIVEEGEILMN